MNLTQLENLVAKTPEKWSFKEVGSWLDDVHLGEYKPIFESSKIDGAMLLILTDDDLSTGLNISNFMHKKRIVKAIKVLRSYI